MTLLDVFRSGSLRALDGLTTARPTESIVSVDFQGVPDDQLPFHLTYVLDWAYGRMANRTGSKLLLVDEAHLLARHPSTEEFLDRVVRHVRHFEAGLVILSQSPEDFLVPARGTISPTQPVHDRIPTPTGSLGRGPIVLRSYGGGGRMVNEGAPSAGDRILRIALESGRTRFAPRHRGVNS